MGSVDSPSRSRTSSFGCQLKRADEYVSGHFWDTSNWHTQCKNDAIYGKIGGIEDNQNVQRHEDENGLTPSQILLQKAKQLSIDGE